jgi:hypothetical protein
MEPLKLKLQIDSKYNGTHLIGLDIDPNHLDKFQQSLEGIQEIYTSDYKLAKELADEAVELTEKVESINFDYSSTPEEKTSMCIKLLQWLVRYQQHSTLGTFKFKEFEELDMTAFTFLTHATVLAQISHAQNL